MSPILIPSSYWSAVKANTKFSSLYTDTAKQCKGAKPTFTCTGYGDYQVVLDVGGVFSNARIESAKTGYKLKIAERQSVGWNPKIEWRLADGNPFAVIVQLEVNDEDEDTPQKIGEILIIKGLQGFEDIDETVDATDFKAIEKARTIADKSYASNLTEKKSNLTDAAYADGKTALLSDEQIKNLSRLNAAIAVPTYIPSGYTLKKVEIQEPEADIIAFSIFYEDAAGKSFQIQSNNEALGAMTIKREVRGISNYFSDTRLESAEFYTGHDENDSETIASEWLCSLKKYQPKTAKIQQCFQVLSNSKSIAPEEAMKIMQSLRYLRR